jgi:hypothetical protein
LFKWNDTDLSTYLRLNNSAYIPVTASHPPCQPEEKIYLVEIEALSREASGLLNRRLRVACGRAVQCASFKNKGRFVNF